MQTDEGDFNPSHSDSNPQSREFRLTRAIRIPHEEIRIQIPISKLRLTDSNPQSRDSNPMWRKKRCWEPPIRIPIKRFESLMKNMKRELKQGFESSNQRFESLKLELWKTRQGDSHLRVMDSNLLAKVKAEGWRSERAIRIFELRIRIPLGAKFKSHSGDSNALHSDSNPS